MLYAPGGAWGLLCLTKKTRIMGTERFYNELPAYVQEVIDNSNYEFDYALEYDSHYTLCTESGCRFEVVAKQ